MKYLKAIFILCSILIISVSVLQAETTPRFEKGVKAGLSYSKFIGDDADLFIFGWDRTYFSKFKSNLTFGGFFRFNLNENYSIQTELDYETKGVKYQLDYEKVDYRIRYLTVPIIFRAELPVGSLLRPNIYLGLYHSFKLSSKAVIYNEAGYASDRDVNNIKDNDQGFLLGAGCDFKIYNLKFFVDGRIAVSFDKISDTKYYDPYVYELEVLVDEDIKNKSLFFTLGMTF